jgi:lipopolysaccharide export system permease protein
MFFGFSQRFLNVALLYGHAGAMTCHMATHPVLFIAPTRIGDAVLASSILAHIQASDPDARVTILTSTLAAPLYEGFPQLERIIPMTKRSYSRHWLGAWRKTIGTRWHSIWDMRNSILTYALLARHRYSFISPKDGAPKIKQYEKVFGITPLPAPALWPRAADIAAAHVLLPAAARYVIFAPIANWAPKEWPLDHFVALAHQLLTGACSGYRPVIICAGHEREKALPMLDALAAYLPIDLTHGDVHLLTIYSLMQRAQGFVGNDSGLMHMASAAGTPTIGLFGPTPNIGDVAPHVHFLYAPDGDLSKLTVDTVASALLKIIL